MCMLTVCVVPQLCINILLITGLFKARKNVATYIRMSQCSEGNLNQVRIYIRYFIFIITYSIYMYMYVVVITWTRVAIVCLIYVYT